MGLPLFIVIVSAVPARAFACAGNRKLFIVGALPGIAEVMRHAERKTLEMPLLRIVQHDQQGQEGDEADGNSKDTVLQRLHPQIHTEESRACRGRGDRTRHAREPKSMSMIALAFAMAKTVESFVEKARRFFHSVMLLGHCCSQCNGSLVMVADGRCRCVSCDAECDATVAFQRCVACGGVPVLRVRRYECRACGSPITSRFLFDGLVFDAEYFRRKMAESRQRRQELRERVKRMLAESRSDTLPLGEADLGTVPGLIDALNGLTAGLPEGVAIESRDGFDLHRYETHIQAHIGDLPLSLAEIPPLLADRKKDLIWRFIAVIFLAHAGVVDIWQGGQDIMVITHETDRERCDISGESEAVGELEGPVDRAEAG